MALAFGSNLETGSVRPEELTISPQEVRSLLGYRGRGMGQLIQARVEHLSNKVLELAAPRYQYRVLPVQSREGEKVCLNGELEFSSQVLATALRHAEACAIFLVTLGAGIMEAIQQRLHQNLVEGYLLDAVASAATESLAELVHQRFAERSGRYGGFVGHRFSPGYCDWHLSEQRVLFRALESEKIGVALTESCLMVPRKTISGLIGVGRNQAQITASPCAECDIVPDCTTRRNRYIQVIRGKQTRLIRKQKAP